MLAILALQGFAGLSFCSVLLVRAQGVTIIYLQMRVISVAHGEFRVIGAYFIIYALFPVLREMRRRKGGNLSGGQQLPIIRALSRSRRCCC